MGDQNGFSRFIIVLTTVTATIIELIDTSIVNVALAQISGNLGATIEDTSWVITAYAIANVIIIPLTGFLAKFFGRKNYYLTSIILFTIASYFCAQSSGLGELVIWRFIQGIGGGALLSTSQSILFDAFPPTKRGLASGLFGMGIVLGPAIGPTLGGYIVDNYHWSWIFLINIPIGMLAATLVYRFVDKKADELNINRKAIRVDYLGVLMLAVGIGSLQYVLERGQSDDWFQSSTIILLTGAAFLGLMFFIWRQLVISYPLLDLRVMKSRNLIVSNILTFVTGFGLFGSVFIFPVMVQRVFGYTPTEAGEAIIPGALVAIFIMPILGRSLSAGVSPIIFVVLGFIFFMLHGYTSSLATPESSRWWFVLPQVLRGIGTSMLIVPLINQAVVGLKPQEMSSGIALTNMLRQLGGAFGIAMMNTYVTQRIALHRNLLLSNFQANDPETLSRLAFTAKSLIARGIPTDGSMKVPLKILDMTLTRQSAFLAYLDAFQLITLFFLAASPFIFLLSRRKVDKETMAKVAEESH